MGHRISRHSINTRSRIHLLDAIGRAQVLRCHLPGRSLIVSADCSEGESTPGTHSQYAADDSLFAHAHADQRVPVAFFFQKLHHGDIVIECCSRTHDLVKICRKPVHLFESLFQFPRAPEVVVGNDHRRPSAQPLQLLRLAPHGTLQFQID